jgi:hypothetical protein
MNERYPVSFPSNSLAIPALLAQSQALVHATIVVVGGVTGVNIRGSGVGGTGGGEVTQLAPSQYELVSHLNEQATGIGDQV